MKKSSKVSVDKILHPELYNAIPMYDNEAKSFTKKLPWDAGETSKCMKDPRRSNGNGKR